MSRYVFILYISVLSNQLLADGKVCDAGIHTGVVLQGTELSLVVNDEVFTTTAEEAIHKKGTSSFKQLINLLSKKSQSPSVKPEEIESTQEVWTYKGASYPMSLLVLKSAKGDELARILVIKGEATRCLIK